MKDSAYDRPDNTGPKPLSFFSIPDSGYTSEHGLYNSTGQLLKGSELFEQYSELAKQLDTKRSVLYLQLKENEIIFGSSLIVKADNGREERVVFIQVNKNLPFGYRIESNIQLIKQFYEAVKLEIETFQFKQYQFIGLWNEGDFLNIKKFPIKKEIIEYTLGKIHDRKRVSVKISELSYGISLLLDLAVRLRHRSLFTFDISQYPSESDLSISLIKPNPDLEIDESGKLTLLAKQDSWDIYKEVGKEIYEDRSDSKENQYRSNSKDLVVKKILKDPMHYCDASNPIFDEFNDVEKIEIIKGLIQSLNSRNSTDVQAIIVSLYSKIKEMKHKKEVHLILFSNEIYNKELIKDLIDTIYKQQNKDFFDVLFRDNTSPNDPAVSSSDKTIDEKNGRKVSKKNSKIYSFEAGIKNSLKKLEYPELVNFVKYIASEAPLKPEKKGRFLIEVLMVELHALKGWDFILALNDKELKNLGEILDADLLSQKRELKKQKINWIKRPALYAGLLVAIILIMFFSYTFLANYFLLGGSGVNNLLNDNKTNNSDLNGTQLGNEDHNSSSDNQTNNSNLNETQIGKTDNNSSSSNQTSIANLNNTGLGKTDNISSSGNQINIINSNETELSKADANSSSDNHTNNSTSN